MKSPLISIIIPTFNREKELKRAINSVISQTYSNWELCVIDNFSSDQTIKLIESYDDQRIKIFMIKNNGVIGASRNLGIKNASGQYLAFLDSDDWWTEDKLEHSIDALNSGAKIVYHDLKIVSKKNQKVFFKIAKTRSLEMPIFSDLIQNGNALLTSSVVVDKESLINVGSFSEEKNLIAIEDYDLWLKLSLSGIIFKKIPKRLGFYWKGGGNTSNPQRTIKVLNELEKKYHNEILKLNLLNKIYWLNYNKSRAFYRLGMDKDAIRSFILTLSQSPNFQIKSKCLAMLIFLYVKGLYNKFKFL